MREEQLNGCFPRKSNGYDCTQLVIKPGLCNYYLFKLTAHVYTRARTRAHTDAHTCIGTKQLKPLATVLVVNQHYIGSAFTSYFHHNNNKHYIYDSVQANSVGVGLEPTGGLYKHTQTNRHIHRQISTQFNITITCRQSLINCLGRDLSLPSHLSNSDPHSTITSSLKALLSTSPHPDAITSSSSSSTAGKTIEKTITKGFFFGMSNTYVP